MKDWIKKHKLIIIIGAIIIIFSWPLIVNCLYNVETDCKVLHKPQEWTIFWGSYIGSIVSAAVAFIILFLQRKDNKEENEKNREENEKNRVLQLKIVEQQQEMQWLNTFRQCSVEYISVYSDDNIREIVNKVKNEPKESLSLIEAMFEKMEKARLMMAFLEREVGYENIKAALKEKHELYNETLEDMKYVIDFYITSENDFSIMKLQISSGLKYVSFDLQRIIRDRAFSFSTPKCNIPLSSYFAKREELSEIVSARFEIFIKKNNDIEAILLAYIKEQEKRIEQITTENKLYGKE